MAAMAAAKAAVRLWTADEMVDHRTRSKTFVAVSAADANRFSCSICLDIVRIPTVTVCKHIFCGPCIRPIATKSAALCPICRAPMDLNGLKIVTDWDEYFCALQSVRVRCPRNVALGCPWVDEYRFALRHERDCGYNLILCECSKFLCHQDKERHQRSCKSCAVCKLCAKFFPKDAIGEHMTSRCLKRKIVCKKAFPIDGCEQTYLAEAQNKHRNLECKSRRHRCSFQSYGCPFAGTSEEITGHMKHATSKHLELAVATCRFQRNLFCLSSLAIRPASPSAEAGTISANNGINIGNKNFGNDWQSLLNNGKSLLNDGTSLLNDGTSFVIRPDDVVDIWDETAQSWGSALVREISTPSRISFDLLETGQPLVLSLPVDRHNIQPAGTKTDPRIIPKTVAISSKIRLENCKAESITKSTTKSTTMRMGAGWCAEVPIPGLGVPAASQYARENMMRGQLVDAFLMSMTDWMVGVWVTGFFLESKRADCHSGVIFRSLVPGALELVRLDWMDRKLEPRGFLIESGRCGVPHIRWHQRTFEPTLLAPAFSYVAPSLCAPNNCIERAAIWPGMLVSIREHGLGLVEQVLDAGNTFLVHPIGSGSNETEDRLMNPTHLKPLDPPTAERLAGFTHSNTLCNDDESQIRLARVADSWIPILIPHALALSVSQSGEQCKKDALAKDKRSLPKSDLVGSRKFILKTAIPKFTPNVERDSENPIKPSAVVFNRSIENSGKAALARVGDHGSSKSGSQSQKRGFAHTETGAKLDFGSISGKFEKAPTSSALSAKSGLQLVESVVCGREKLKDSLPVFNQIALVSGHSSNSFQPVTLSPLSAAQPHPQMSDSPKTEERKGDQSPPPLEKRQRKPAAEGEDDDEGEKAKANGDASDQDHDKGADNDDADGGDKSDESDDGSKKKKSKAAAKKKTKKQSAGSSKKRGTSQGKKKAKSPAKKKASTKKRRAPDSDNESGNDDDNEDGGSKKKKRRTKKKKDGPKKPMSSYLYYFMTHQKAYKESHPGEQQSDVMKALSQQWGDIKGTENAAPYEAMAAKDKVRFQTEESEYNAKHGITPKPKKTKTKPAPAAPAAAEMDSGAAEPTAEVTDVSSDTTTPGLAPSLAPVAAQA
jgi:HMG (high mobility group) box/Zinc finger, C3HC4 type (RING finger)